jgi:hypothetical protein
LEPGRCRCHGRMEGDAEAQNSLWSPIMVQYIWYWVHRIGWRENLQETPIFDGKNHGFL